eukprot:scpid13924/ scgid12987/ 
MPRFSKAASQFLTDVAKGLEKDGHVPFSCEELPSKFEGAVAVLPEGQLKDELIKKLDACISLLRTELKGKFFSIPVPEKSNWTLHRPDGISQALSNLTAHDQLEYAAILATRPGQAQAKLVLGDFLQKAGLLIDCTDGTQVGLVLKSFSLLSVVECLSHDILASLWKFLNDQLGTAESISNNYGCVAKPLENILLGATLKRKEEIETAAKETRKSKKRKAEDSSYFDVIAACTAWLLEAHIVMYNCGEKRDSLDTVQFLNIVIGETCPYHLLDVFLQISVPPASPECFNFLLPLLVWACDMSRSVTSAANYVKFLACNRVGIHLSKACGVPELSTLWAEFRKIGLSVQPPPDLAEWLHQRCSSSLLESLALDSRWSVFQLSMHLLLYADNDNMDSLLDVVAGHARSQYAAAASQADDAADGTAAALTASADEAGLADGFVIDAAASNTSAMQDEFSPVDVSMDSDCSEDDDIIADSDDEDDGEIQ